MATGTISKYMDGTDSGWLEYTNSSVFSGTIYYRKMGEFLVIESGSITLKTTLAAKSNRDLANGNAFPTAYRTQKAIVIMGFVNSGYVNNRYLPLRLTTDGNLYIYSGAEAINGETETNIYSLFFSGMGV